MVVTHLLKRYRTLSKCEDKSVYYTLSKKLFWFYFCKPEGEGDDFKLGKLYCIDIIKVYQSLSKGFSKGNELPIMLKIRQCMTV